jgi:hypothetical protein
MAFIQKRLHGPAAMATSMATSAANIYTTPNATATIVKQILLCNTAALAQTATLYVAAFGAATAAKTIFKAISLDPSETLILNLSLVLAAGEIISGSATDAGVTITISGIEEA